MKVNKTFLNSTYIVSNLSNKIYLHNTSFLNMLKIPSKVLLKNSVNSTIFRIINNYSAFSSIISKSLTMLAKSNKVGFVELDLID